MRLTLRANTLLPLHEGELEVGKIEADCLLCNIVGSIRVCMPSNFGSLQILRVDQQGLAIQDGILSDRHSIILKCPREQFGNIRWIQIGLP